MIKRGGVPVRCQHRAHWWPHWRVCWRRYMLYGCCRKHDRVCAQGCTQAQREELAYQLAEAIRDGRVPRRRVPRG